MHVFCAHTFRQTYIDIVPSITSIEHHFEWQILRTLCLTASLSSLPIRFPPIVCWPDPCKTFFPYRTKYTYTPYIRSDPDEADSGGINECEMWAVSEAATYPPYVFSSIRSTSFPFPCSECIPYFLVLLLYSGCEPLESLTYHTKLTTLYPVKDKTNITNRQIRLNLPRNAVSRALRNQI